MHHLLRIGFAPAHLSGIELLPERWAQARAVLPATLRLVEGDALQADVPPASQDLGWIVKSSPDGAAGGRLL